MFKKTFISMLCLAGSQAFAQGPSVNDVNISGLRYTGTGCPQGTAETIVTSSRAGRTNADYFQITYDSFSAKSGQGVSLRERRKNCNLFMNVHYPRNYRFKFKSTSFSGYANIEQGLTATFRTIYSEPFKSRVQTRKSIFGPKDKDFDHNETVSFTNGFYSNCSGSMLLKIENWIELSGGRRLNGEITRDIQSGLLTSAYGLVWERC